tara:strand:+ start:917 stop:1252 length:336 start_codon:yes stop_codon:yes gene_type:complete
MQENRSHHILRFFTLLVVVLLMLPMTVKSAFIFEEHHHDICADNQTDSHLHTKDLHCELYKFTAFTHFITIENEGELPVREDITQIINYNYNFLHNHRPLSFSLRGPPCFV